MYTVQNKQYSLAHIAVIEFVEEPINEIDPRDGKTKPWYAFKMHMSYEHVENMLYETKNERDTAWEKVIDKMEEAGY